MDARVFFIALLTLVTWKVYHYDCREIPLSSNKPTGHVFDYIIVGAGTAGSVLASRLSEDPDMTVLVMEAGGKDDRSAMHVPALYRSLKETSVDWKYRLNPQLGACDSFDKNAVWWPMGKTLGGTSSIGGMVYSRGAKSDYDSWAGASSRDWNYDSLLPYFDKVERQLFGNSDEEFLGIKSSGPSANLNPEWVSDPAKVFLQAGADLGFGVREGNVNCDTGFSRTLSTTRRGARVSTAGAYLHPARQRPNLFVKTNSRVKRIIFDDALRAVGLEYFLNEVPQSDVYRARREIILSAGVVESPHTLLVSGIGPRASLEEFRIPVLKDLPGVGKNLQDHVMVAMEYWLDANVSRQLDLLSEESLSRVSNKVAYSLWGSGPLGASPIEATAFLPVSNASSDPEIQILFSGGNVPLHDYEHSGFASQGINQLLGHAPFSDNPPKGYTFFVSLPKPSSRGEVRFEYQDPFYPPFVNPKYLDSEKEVQMLLKGIRRVEELVDTPAFGKIGGFPSLKNARSSYPYGSEQFWTWYIRHATWTTYDYCGTCKMGAGSDPMAVVDARLRVRGVAGLRVVDASVVPDLPRGGLLGPVAMVAEKAADMIRADRTG